MMKDNQLVINSNGIWIKTSEDNVDSWRVRIHDTLKIYSYRMVKSLPLHDVTHSRFEKGTEEVIVNCFKNGYIHFGTKHAEKIMDSIISHLEMKLMSRFERLPDSERFIYTPHLPKFLIDKSEDVPKYEMGCTYERTGWVSENPTLNAAVMSDSYLKMQDDLVKTRKKLANTEIELASVGTEISRMSKDIEDTKDRSERYLQYRYETFFPLHDNKRGSHYQRILDESRKEAEKK